jgi:hypothetical protein
LAAIEHVQAILDHPDFRRLQSSIARALAACPRIEREEIELLAEAHLSNPNEEPAWST